MTKKKNNLLSKIYLLLFWIRKVKNNRDKDLFADLWQKTWLDQGYATETTLAELIKHYRKYDEFAEDFILYFLGKPIGTIRLIIGKLLPVVEDFEVESI